MDILTHIFIPLIFLSLFKKEILEKPLFILIIIGIFGVLPDVDKFLGIPGFLHSFLVLSLILALILFIEYVANREIFYTVIIALLLYSHLFLDILDSSPVALLYPFFDETFHIEFPLKVNFNNFIISFSEIPLKIVIGKIDFNFESYTGVFTGNGVLSMLLFCLVYLQMKRDYNKFH